MEKSPIEYQPDHAPYVNDRRPCFYCGDPAVRQCSDKRCAKEICSLHTANFGALPMRDEDTYCLACFDKWLKKKQEKLK